MAETGSPLSLVLPTHCANSIANLWTEPKAQDINDSITQTVLHPDSRSYLGLYGSMMTDMCVRLPYKTSAANSGIHYASQSPSKIIAMKGEND